MALPSNYRWIVLGRLVIRNRSNSPHYAPEFLLADVIRAIADRENRNENLRSYAKDTRLMWCTNLEEDDNHYRLLLQTGDKNVTGVSFLDFQTLETRDVDKEEHEGGHYTAHVLIRKTPDVHGHHLVLLEKVPGIHLAAVKAHLTWVCNNPLYEKLVQDDEGRRKSFRAYFDLDGHQSRTIREALRNGVLQDVELISHEENHPDGLDEDPLLQEVVHETRWEIKRRVTEDQARNVFQRIGDAIGGLTGDRDNAQMFVRIKADNGQIKRTEVNHDGDEILEQAFVQNELVSNFEEALTQRYDALRQDMIEKMTEIADSVVD